MNPTRELKKIALELEKRYSEFGPDFKNADVRGLMGMFADFQGWSKDALEEMEKWLSEGEYDISFKEAKERVQYYLSQMGIR